jgi:integrase
VRGALSIYKSQRANGTWVYEVRLPGKQRLYETVGTRLDQAKARAREVHAGPVQVTSVATTIDQAVEDWRRTRQMRPRSAETLDQQYRSHIQPVLGHRKVRDINPREIEAWLNGLRRKDGRDGDLSLATKRLALSTLQIILAHAVEMGVIAAVPKLPRRKTPKVPEGRKRILSQDEEQRLLAYCARSDWLRPIIVVALHQALRLGEVLALQWDDVDFVGGKMHIRRSVDRHGSLGPTKGGREDEIPLTPKAREALLELRLDSDGTGFVFRNGNGMSRDQGVVHRAYSNAVRAAALPVTRDGKVVFHTLRHTGISRLANHPAIPAVQVRDFARHSNLVTTQGYVHRIESQVVTAAIAEALAGSEADAA